MMDSLTTLLASVTRSLAVLQKKPKSTETPSGTDSAADAGSTTTPEFASGGDAAPSVTYNASTTEAATTSTSDDKGKEKSKESEGPPSADILLENHPQIPDLSLKLVVNVLHVGESSSRTFSPTLTLIRNLSNLESRRNTILDELKARAEKISNDLIPDLQELVETINRDETVSSTTLSKFTPVSSSQAKLLRVLKTIDFFGTAPQQTNKSSADRILSPEEEQVKVLYTELAKSDLWKRLGDALGAIEAKSELLYLSTVLLPLIESLLVVNKFTDSSSTEFIDFTMAHSKILNSMVRNNPSLISGSFAVLVRNSTMLDYENKRSFFFSRLHDRSVTTERSISTFVELTFSKILSQLGAQLRLTPLSLALPLLSESIKEVRLVRVQVFACETSLSSLIRWIISFISLELKHNTLDRPGLVFQTVFDDSPQA